MTDHYDPPGKKVQERDGVKYVDVREEVGQRLIDEYDFEALDESSDDQTDDSEDVSE